MLNPLAALALDELIPGLVGLTLASAGVAWFGWLVARAVASRSWQVVEGRVLSSETHIVDRGNNTSSPARRTTVTYEYVVGSTRYVSTRVWFGDRFDLSAATAETLKARFVPGHAVEVRYDSSRPSEATLEARASWLVWLGLVGSLALAALLVNELFLRR